MKSLVSCHYFSQPFSSFPSFPHPCSGYSTCRSHLACPQPPSSWWAPWTCYSPPSAWWSAPPSAPCRSAPPPPPAASSASSATTVPLPAPWICSWPCPWGLLPPSHCSVTGLWRCDSSSLASCCGIWTSSNLVRVWPGALWWTPQPLQSRI